MIDSMHVLDVLRKRGYVPQDDADAGENWFDRNFGVATVRTILAGNDGVTGFTRAEIYLFIGPVVHEWHVSFTDAPQAVILATLDAAEAQAREIADMHTAIHPRGRRHSPGWAGSGYGGG
jgi:hypothetical protein